MPEYNYPLESTTRNDPAAGSREKLEQEFPESRDSSCRVPERPGWEHKSQAIWRQMVKIARYATLVVNEPATSGVESDLLKTVTEPLSDGRVGLVTLPVSRNGKAPTLGFASLIPWISTDFCAE